MNRLTRLLLVCCLMALGLVGAMPALATVAANDSYPLTPDQFLLDGQGQQYYLLTPLSNDSDYTANTLDITAMQSSIVFTQGGGTIVIVNASIVEYRFYPDSVSVPSEFTYDLIDPQTSPPTSTASVVVNFASVPVPGPVADDPCLDNGSSFCELSAGERSQQLSTIAAQTEAVIGMQQRMADQLRSRFSELRNGTNRLSVNHLNAQIYGESLALGQWSQAELNDMTGGGASDSLGAIDPWGVFVTGTVAVGERDTDDSTMGYDSDGYNVSLGMDYRFSDTLVWGGALGLGADEIEFGQNMGKQESDLTSMATFINFYPSDATYVDALLIYGLTDLDTQRNFLGETAKGTTEGSALSAALSAGYETTSGAWQYGAYSRFEYVKADVDGYSEEGSSANFTVSDHDNTSSELALGGRVGRAFSLAKCVLVPSLDLEWVQQLESDSRLLGVSVEGLEPLFSSYDEGFDEGHANVGLSFTAVFAAGMSTFTRAETTVADDITSLQTYSAGVRWEF